jgi:hypothetical protein
MLMKVGEVELTSQGWEEYYKGLPTLREEFARADLGRASRNKTLDRVVKLAEARPERSLPQMSASKAEREMFYRFFGNEAIEAEKLLEPHVFLPIAHRLLLLRSLPRTAPNLPASIVLTNSQLTVLRLKLPKHLLPPAPTVQQALFAVAALGGHFSARRFPGWQVLGRGYEQLILLEQGFLLASGAFS